MRSNPYEPPSQAGIEKPISLYGRFANMARTIMAIIFMIVGGLLPSYSVIYFGESIRWYTEEMPVHFRLLLFVVVLGLTFCGAQQGGRLSQFAASKIFPSSDDKGD